MEIKIGQEFTRENGDIVKVTDVYGDKVDYTINEFEAEGTARRDIFLSEVIKKDIEWPM